MIQLIKDSAQAVGIALVISNSEQAIEVQLNSLTHKVERGDPANPSTITRGTDLPIMLISWDIDTELNFNSNSFLDNPDSKIVALLMKKASSMQKQTLETASEEMALLFRQFIQDLYNRLIPFMRTSTTPITGAGYKLVPKYGGGKHSGVLARWKMKTGLDVC
jgi:hypothetical protein